MHIWKIIRSPGALGDALMTAHFVHILNQNGIQAVYEGDAIHLVACPTSDSVPADTRFIEWEFDYELLTDRRQSIIDFNLNTFARQFRSVLGDRQFVVDRLGIPLRYRDIASIAGADVAMVTKSSDFAPIRNYPFFRELKQRLTANGITFLDLTEQGLIDLDCINAVVKSKIYWGLETGVSHLVSSLIDESNSLILQGGHSTEAFWAKYYRFDFMSVHLDCAPCGLRNLDQCSNGHRCLTELTPQWVCERVIAKLDGRRPRALASGRDCN
jgi:hypothetical protein